METGSEFLPDCVEGENVLNSNFPVTFGIANLTKLLPDYKALEKINTSGMFKITDFQWIVIGFNKKIFGKVLDTPSWDFPQLLAGH